MSRAADSSSFTSWVILTLVSSVLAFPLLWLFAWRRFSSAGLTPVQRARSSATTAAKAILPLWAMTSIVGFFLVMIGSVVFLWIYAFFFAPPGGVNVGEKMWLLTVPGPILYAVWYLFCLVCVIRWLPKTPHETFVM